MIGQTRPERLMSAHARDAGYASYAKLREIIRFHDRPIKESLFPANSLRHIAALVASFARSTHFRVLLGD